MTLGKTYAALGEYEPAETNLRAALAASLQGNGKRHPTTATTMGWLGLTLVYRNKLAEGEQISRQAVDLQRQLHPKGNEDLGVALYALGVSLIYKDQPKAAQPLLQEASELLKKHLGETNGYYMTSLVMLARAHENADEPDVAESLYRQAIEVGGRVEARYRIYLAQAQFYLGLMLINKGAYPEAEILLLQSEAIYRKVMGGDDNSSVGATRSNLAVLHLREGNYAKAENEARTALDLLRKHLGTDQPLTAGALSTLGLTLTREGKAAEGEPYLRDALAIRTKVVRLDSFLIPYTESALGECLIAQQRYAEAEPLLTDGYTGLIWKLGEKDLRTIEARQRLAKLYDAWDKPEQAVLFR
jgi:tetratricopeptide (TPR) repeat protein